MKERILQALKQKQEKNEYISGQELCQRFSVSRTAVWKAVNALKAEGYEIEAVRNRGYRLTGCPDILLSEEIKTGLKTSWWGKKILYFQVIDSTNLVIKKEAEAGAPEGLLAIAEEQTAGRGRRGRSWSSPPGTGIWMSFLLRPRVMPERASMITLITALACAKAIEELTGLTALIKWPNDIVVNGKKIVGILTEMSTEMTCINYVVTGIGINANMLDFPEDIRAHASSLALEKGEKISRSGLVALFGCYFEKYYDRFCRTGDLRDLKEDYESLLVNKGRQVLIVGDEGTDKRTALGINEMGELLVQSENGEIKTVRSGEVSVRGLYGYV